MSFSTSAADLAKQLRISLDHPDDVAAAVQLLADAQAVIEEEAGQPLESEQVTLAVDGTGTCELVLPRWPVTAVDSVTETDADGNSEVLVEGEGEDFTWGSDGLLTRLGAVWPCGQRNISVVVTAGFVTVPTSLLRIQRRLAAAGWHNPAGADSEQTADHNVRWHTAGMELTTAERRIIGRYAAR